MRVLVTGDRGYVGAVLARLLVLAGHEVHGLDADLYAGRDFSPTLLDLPSVATDVRDVTVGQLAGFDAIVHLAGLPDDPQGDLGCLTLDIDQRATVRLAGLARAAGVSRFVLASSIGGARADALTEERVRALAGNASSPDGFSPVVLRLGSVHGVSPRLRLDLALNDLVAQAITTRAIHVRADGPATGPLVHVQDAAQALRAALEAPRERVHGEALDVGTDDGLRPLELAQRVVAALPGTRLEVTGVDPGGRGPRADHERLRGALPTWAPRWTVTSGIQELALAFRARGLQAGDRQRYERLADLRRRLADGSLGPDLRRGEPALAGVPRRAS